MSRELSRVRRFAIAAVTLALACLLFRTQIAGALVIRGDDYMYRGDRVAALEHYRRALAFSPSLEVAADRFVFISLQRQTPAALRTAVSVADGFLAAHPGDASLLRDRALCYLHLHRYSSAQRDFEEAARATHAASDYVFAGWAARHAGRERFARVLWRRALDMQPRFRPALIALSERPE